MSHPSEWQTALYVDDELDPEARRELAAHLVGCESCRRLVVALREEERVLRRVLGEGDAPEADSAAAAPARGLLLGLPAALLLVGTATAVAGAILETRLAAGVSWLSLPRLFGVTEMLFDLVFALRDRAPGLLEFAVAVAATATLAALVTFAAGLLLRRVSGRAVLGTLAAGLVAAHLLAAPAPATAALRLHHDSPVHVAEGDVVEGALVVSGDSVRIDGMLRGSLVVFAERLSIRGTVEGDVYAFAREVDVVGRVDGTLHVACRDLRIDGQVGGGVLAAAERLHVGEEGRVARDLALFVDTANIAGHVGRDVLGRAGRLTVTGQVARDVEIHAGRVLLERGARVAGDLRAHVPAEDLLEVAPGAQVVGQSEALLRRHAKPSGLARYAEPRFYLWLVVRAAGAFALGLLLFAVWPALFAGALPTGRAFAASLGRGFAFLLLAPMGLTLLALTLVGIPAALLGTALYVAALYVAGLVVAALLGAALVRPANRRMADFALVMAVGVAVLVVAMNLPFLGILVRVIVAMVGLGLLVDRARAAFRGGGAPATLRAGREMP